MDELKNYMYQLFVGTVAVTRSVKLRLKIKTRCVVLESIDVTHSLWLYLLLRRLHCLYCNVLRSEVSKCVHAVSMLVFSMTILFFTERKDGNDFLIGCYSSSVYHIKPSGLFIEKKLDVSIYSKQCCREFN